MPHPVRRFSLMLALAGLLFADSAVRAQAVPSVSSTQPGAVAPGAATKLKVRGGNLVGAADFWTSFGGQLGLAGDVKDNGKNAAEVTWDVTLPPGTPVGVHGIRVATPGGVSAMKLIMVDGVLKTTYPPDKCRGGLAG